MVTAMEDGRGRRRERTEERESREREGKIFCIMFVSSTTLLHLLLYMYIMCILTTNLCHITKAN